MLDRRSLHFAAYFLRAYPARTAAIMVLLCLAGAAEGLGIATLLPVLEIALDGGPSDVASNRLVLAVFRVLDRTPTLGGLLALVVATLTLKALFRWLAMRKVGYAVARVAADLRLRLVRALMSARWTYFTRERTGRFANALGNEAARAAYAYRRACGAGAAAIQIVVYVGVAMVVAWRLAAVALLAGVAVTALFARFVRTSRAAGGVFVAVVRSLAARTTEVVEGIKAIKAMGRERQFLALLESEAAELERAERRLVLAHESLQAFHEPVLAALIGAGIFIAVTRAGEPFSVLLLMVFIFQRILSRFHTLQIEYQEMVSGQAAFWSLHARAQRAEARPERSAAGTPPPLAEGIALEDVSFGYRGHTVLRDVSLYVPAGRFVAITGRSGTGKTTLVDLVLGLHQPASGRVRVDGVPLDTVDPRAWRRLIGYIPQETMLLHDTIARNVSLGADGIGRDRIETALREAGAWDFVTRLPRGPDTVVGERGTRLSGGERQRVAIARALVGRPRVLVLDEATTGLDRETEAAILRTLDALRGRVTIIAVSHQPALAEAADVVYEVEAGAVAERARVAPG